MKHIKILIPITLCVFTAGSLTSFTPADHPTKRQEIVAVYEMYVNDEPVGVMKHAAKGLNYYDKVMDTLKEKYPEDVDILSDVYFKEVDAMTAVVTGEPKIAAAIEKAVDIETEAYAIKMPCPFQGRGRPNCESHSGTLCSAGKIHGNQPVGRSEVCGRCPVRSGEDCF